MRTPEDSIPFPKALVTLKWVVTQKHPKPVMECVRLSADGDALKIEGTDLRSYLTVRASVPGLTVTGDGSTVVPLRRFAASLKRVKAGTIRLGAEDVEIASDDGRKRFTVRAEDPEAWPSEPAFERQPSTVPNLGAALARAAMFAAPEAGRYALHGVNLTMPDKGQMVAVSTDGRRLSLDTLEASRVLAGNVILDALACKIAARHEASSIAWGKQGKHRYAVITGPGYRLLTTGIDGSYPQYEDVIPPLGRPDTFSAGFDPAALTEALDDAMVLTTRDAMSVRIVSEDDCIRIRSRAKEVGQADIAAPYSNGRSLKGAPDVGLNPKFAKDAIAACGSSVDLTLRDSKSPLRFDGENGYVHVLMPIALDF